MRPRTKKRDPKQVETLGVSIFRPGDNGFDERAAAVTPLKRIRRGLSEEPCVWTEYLGPKATPAGRRSAEAINEL